MNILHSRNATQVPLITSSNQVNAASDLKRHRKYLLLMSIRIPALILSVIVYSLTKNPWLAGAVLIASIPLPLMAVMIANDGEPVHKKRKTALTGKKTIQR